MRTAGRNDGKLSITAQLQITDAGRFLTLGANYTKKHVSAITAVIVNMHRFINSSS